MIVSWYTNRLMFWIIILLVAGFWSEFPNWNHFSDSLTYRYQFSFLRLPCCFRNFFSLRYNALARGYATPVIMSFPSVGKSLKLLTNFWPMWRSTSSHTNFFKNIINCMYVNVVFNLNIHHPNNDTPYTNIS